MLLSRQHIWRYDVQGDKELSVVELSVAFVLNGLVLVEVEHGEGALDELVPVELEVIEKLEEVNGTRVIHVYLLKNFEETSRLMGWWGWWVSGLVHVGMDG